MLPCAFRGAKVQKLYKNGHFWIKKVTSRNHELWVSPNLQITTTFYWQIASGLEKKKYESESQCAIELYYRGSLDNASLINADLDNPVVDKGSISKILRFKSP